MFYFIKSLSGPLNFLLIQEHTKESELMPPPFYTPLSAIFALYTCKARFYSSQAEMAVIYCYSVFKPKISNSYNIKISSVNITKS